jgi:ankyrin repeat protein
MPVRNNHADNLGFTALYGAAYNGQVDALQALLAAGAEVDLTDNLGRTALWVAAYWGHVLAIRVLLNAGADINRASNDGRTPLAAARTPARAARNHQAVLALVQAGATE